MTYGSGAGGANGAFLKGKCWACHRRGGHGEAEKGGSNLHDGLEKVLFLKAGFGL